MDAVRQHGLPSLFLTISPFEWTFPFPKWLSDIRDLYAVGPTKIPSLETLAIANSLEQIEDIFLVLIVKGGKVIFSAIMPFKVFQIS